MTGFRRVLRNAGWNLLSTVLPLGAAVLAIPFLARRLGTEAFGLLTLGWVLVGYFSLFDFGLGRALTKLVAERTGTPRKGELRALCSTGTALALAAGLLGAALVAAALPWAGNWLGDGDTPGLRQQAQRGLLVIAMGIPPTVATAALRGVLEGQQRFRLLTTIRVPAGVLLFAAPCLSAAFTPRLDMALAAMVATRWLGLLAHAWPCAGVVTLSRAWVRWAWVAPLLRLGGWMTVSNVVSPVIVHADRFVIGGLVSAAALAYYAVPFEAVSRLLVLPVALSGALFPALAAVQARPDALPQARALRRQALALTLLGVVPAAALAAWLAEPLLRAWVGADYAAAGTTAMQILLLGFSCNAAAQIPFAALQGLGLARQTALLHLAELPLYMVMLVAMVLAWGIDGAAAAWALRAAADCLALTWLLRRAERLRDTGLAR